MSNFVAVRVLLFATLFFVVCISVYFLQSILWPFLLSFLLAYIFKPLVGKLERIGVPRSLASFCVTIIFSVIVIGFLAILLPFLISQLDIVVTKIPIALDIIHKKLQMWNISIPSWEGARAMLLDTIQNMDRQALTTISSNLSSIVKNLSSFANVVFLLILLPILLYYFLKDWDVLRTFFVKIFPARYSTVILEWMGFVSAAVAGFLRGQLTVMVILGLWYIFILNMIGLQNAFFVGFFTGMIVFIPYVGAFIGVCVATLTATIQFGDIWHLLMIWGAYAFGQSVESMILTPIIVGKNVGLHAVWIMFALMIGGYMFGFIGVLLAVPVAAAIGGTLRFAFAQYVKSDYYSA